MNLKEALSYRSKCIIHPESNLHPRSSSPAIIELNKDGLRANPNKNAVKSKILAFNYDGTFYPPGNYECIVYMQCDECVKTPILKNRSLGFTTLQNISSNYYFYNLMLKSKLNDENFDCYLIGESIKYVQNDKFYHIDFDIKEGKASCKMGDCRGDAILDDMLNGMLSLDLPNLDMSRIWNTEQLVNKLKLYNLFS
jgi:hypothetical protein